MQIPHPYLKHNGNEQQHSKSFILVPIIDILLMIIFFLLYITYIP
jgi:hypothetical protein